MSLKVAGASTDQFHLFSLPLHVDVCGRDAARFDRSAMLNGKDPFRIVDGKVVWYKKLRDVSVG